MGIQRGNRCTGYGDAQPAVRYAARRRSNWLLFPTPSRPLSATNSPEPVPKPLLKRRCASVASMNQRTICHGVRAALIAARRRHLRHLPMPPGARSAAVRRNPITAAIASSSTSVAPACTRSRSRDDNRPTTTNFCSRVARAAHCRSDRDPSVCNSKKRRATSSVPAPYHVNPDQKSSLTASSEEPSRARTSTTDTR